MHGKKGKGLSGNWDFGNCASLLELGNGDWEFGNERESGESDNWEKEGRRQRVIQKREGDRTVQEKKEDQGSTANTQVCGNWDLGNCALLLELGNGDSRERNQE